MAADRGHPHIPPSVHRASSPPPTAPTEAARPAKTPKPPKAPKPEKATATSAGAGAAAAGRGAGLAFVLAVVSLVTAGILAIPALILAGRARRQGAKAGLVTATRLVAVVSLLAWLAVAGIVIANVAQPDGVDYAKLKVGDCIDTPEGSEVRRLTVRACDEAHDAEVFAVVIHPAAPATPSPAPPPCSSTPPPPAWASRSPTTSASPGDNRPLTEFEIVPESEAWAEGRRGLVCAVDNADRSPLTASVKGSAK